MTKYDEHRDCPRVARTDHMGEEVQHQHRAYEDHYSVAKSWWCKLHQVDYCREC